MTAVSVQVLAKTPLAGQVKTRLAAVLGHHGCVRLARGQLARTLAVAREAGVGPVTLRLPGGPWHPFVRREAGRHGAALAAQHGVDLGERMARAARAGLRRRGAVILLGTDCPGLAPGDLQDAAARLAAGADVVLGPALDGGYYLAALGRPAPPMFRGLAWGGAGLLAATRRRLEAAGYRVALLAPRADLDRPAELPGSPFLAGPGRLFQRGE